MFSFSISFRKKAFIFANIFLILFLINPVLAESPTTKATRVKKQIASMRSNLSDAFSDYKKSVSSLEKLNKKLDGNKIKLEQLSIKLQASQKILGKRISSMYRYSDVTFLDILLGSNSFNEMLVNLDFITRVGSRDAQIISKVKKLRKQVVLIQKRLINDQANQRQLVKKKRGKKDYINSKMSKAKKMLVGLEKEIKELAKPKPLPAPVAQQIAPPAQSSTSATNGNYAFPAGAPFSFSNDWGAPRGGGTRRHKGTDILAPGGTSAYAVTSGSVSSSYGKSAGKWIILHGNDGNTYWYMHMQSITAGGSVSTGQAIGTVGNTGNASGGPTHIHFEIHPGGGSAINPYFFLTSIQ